MSKILLKCEVCNKEFERSKKEYNRSKKLGRRMFCSRACCGKGVSLNLGKDLGNGILRENFTRSLDEYSPFRYFIRKARNRSYDYDIDLEYLKNLWTSQDGICPISGIQMELYPSASAWEKDKGNPWKPSLDRIDSSKGYIKGNVRFICYIANMCKQDWPDEVLIEFCNKVVKNEIYSLR